MSETTNLKLFKHNEPLEENQNQFDIDLALNQNWDKIDNFAGNVNDKVIEFEDKNEEHDLDISGLQQENKTQTEEITKLKQEKEELEEIVESILPNGQAEGEYITLKDSANYPCKVTVEGNSWQKTREGYNLLDVEKEFTVNSSKVMNVILEPGIYTIKFEDVNTSNTNITSYVCAFYLGGTAVSYQHIAKDNKKKTFTLSSNVDSIRIWSADSDTESQGVTTIYKNLMIYAGNEDRGYEEYGASPSPKYPSKIENVGDNINLFDKNNANILNSAIDSNGIGINAGDTYKTIYILCKPNTTYTVSKLYDATKNRFGLAYTSTEPTYSMKVEGYISNSNASNLTIKTGTNAKYLLAYVWITGGTTTYQEMIDSIKIEEGEEATSYSPYNCGSVELNVCNKNLCYNSSVLNPSNVVFYFNPRLIEKNFEISFIVNADLNLNSLYINYGGSENPRVAQITSKANTKAVKNITFTDDVYDALKNSKMAYFQLYKENAGFTKLEETMILNNTNTNAIYTEHKEQDIVFPFVENQRLMKGDFLGEDEIHHVRKQFILDGTEVWQLGNTGSNTTNQRFYLHKNFIKANGDITSNYFKQVYKGSVDIFNNDVEGCNISNGQYIQLKINKEIASTVDKLHAWIKQKKDEGNPLIFECELEQEEIEPYTEEQKLAKAEIDKLKTYKNITNIFTDSKANLKADYKKDIETLLNQTNQVLVERS